jgi:hypothetical protein
MSYLRGPLTRDQIRRLMAPGKLASAPPVAAVAAAPPAAPPSAAVPAAGGTRPVLPPDIQQFFVPAAVPRPGSAGLCYAPMAVGAASVGFSDPKTGVSHTRGLTIVAGIDPRLGSVEWGDGTALSLAARDLASEPAAEGRFLDLAPAAAKAKSYDAWSKSFKSWLGQSQALELLKSRATGLVSAPGESERDFRVRLQAAARERRDQAVEKLRQKYAPKIAALDEKIRRAQQAVERESAQATQQKLQTAVSMGATVFGALFGRKAVSASTLGRATTAARGMGRTMKESQDIERARQTLAAAAQQKADLESQVQDEINALGGALDPLAESFDPVVLRPKRTELTVHLVALAWAPVWVDDRGQRTPAYR